MKLVCLKQEKTDVRYFFFFVPVNLKIVANEMAHLTTAEMVNNVDYHSLITDTQYVSLWFVQPSTLNKQLCSCKRTRLKIHWFCVSPIATISI